MRSLSWDLQEASTGRQTTARNCDQESRQKFFDTTSISLRIQVSVCFSLQNFLKSNQRRFGRRNQIWISRKWVWSLEVYQSLTLHVCDHHLHQEFGERKRREKRSRLTFVRWWWFYQTPPSSLKSAPSFVFLHIHGKNNKCLTGCFWSSSITFLTFIAREKIQQESSMKSKRGIREE